MAEPSIIWLSGVATGLVMAGMARRPPRDRDPDWRRSFNHENTNRNSSETRPRKFSSGYQPRSQGGPTNLPPEEP